MENTGILVAHRGAQKIARQDLALLPIPDATRTHQPVPHSRIVDALVEALGFRHIAVVRDEYAATPDGMKMFGVLDLNYEFTGCRFSIGIRNSNDKSMRLALTIGYRVFVCDNLAFMGDFTPVLAKHSKRLELLDSISVGLDKMQRYFDPLQRTINQWREHELIDVQAKGIIYDAVIEGHLPAKLLSDVNTHYFEPTFEEFQPRTLWSLSNAFTETFKQLQPVPFFQRTAKLNPFLERYNN